MGRNNRARSPRLRGQPSFSPARYAQTISIIAQDGFHSTNPAPAKKSRFF